MMMEWAISIQFNRFVWWILCSCVHLGMGNAVEILCGQAYGAHKCIYPKINNPPHCNWYPTDVNLHFLEGHPSLTGWIVRHCLSSCSVCVWSNIPTIRLCCQLIPNTKVPPSPEHCVSKCLHSSSHPLCPPPTVLATDTEFILVDHSGGSVCIHN